MPGKIDDPIVYFQGRPLYVIAEDDTGAITASPLATPIVFQSGEEYEGYTFHAESLTDADGNPLKEPSGHSPPKSKVPKTSGKD